VYSKQLIVAYLAKVANEIKKPILSKLSKQESKRLNNKFLIEAMAGEKNLDAQADVRLEVGRIQLLVSSKDQPELHLAS